MRDVTDEGPTALQASACVFIRAERWLNTIFCIFFVGKINRLLAKPPYLLVILKPTFLLVRLVRQPFFVGKIVLVPTTLRP